ncbi:MAG: sorbosone dehydrogenase family protein [Acidobacteriia bacterium]|nr:sorbosone dehydrogenase family protein [Terriglobia bacterium]
MGGENSSGDLRIFHDYRTEKPGQTYKITVADLPRPYTTHSVDNGPRLIRRPADAWPQAPAGFKVDQYAAGLDNPRLLRTAPNGDVFLAESRPGRIKIFRGVDKNGQAQTVSVFASGLDLPFGIAFYPPGPNPKYVYVGNTGSVVRFPYENGDLKARGPAETIAEIPSGGHLRGGGHWTRDLAFSLDGQHLFISVGSHSNVDDTDGNPREHNRADILEANPDGTGLHVYAWGIRNAVGIAVHPRSGELWASVNERDELGDNLPPDYITHIQEGGFYGWPWFYIGDHQDPRHAGKHPELRNNVIVPDVLLQPHYASLELAFYEGSGASAFPKEYSGEIFAAEHGSWNRALRTGYEVIRVPLKDRHATGEYQDFLTGFVTPQGEVWGRPVGVAVAPDGSLLISDDGSESIWRVSYTR